MDDEFKLCWKNFQDNIASGFQNLYDRGDLVDVTLACDGKLLHAHKFVLAICSPYFQEIFITNPCKHPTIILKDVSFNIMCELLEFMYQGVVNVKHTELQSFMKVGQQLQIKGLASNPSASPGSISSEKNSTQAQQSDDGPNPNEDVVNNSHKNETTKIEKTMNADGKSTSPATSPLPINFNSSALTMFKNTGNTSTPTLHHGTKRHLDLNSDAFSIFARKQFRRTMGTHHHPHHHGHVHGHGHGSGNNDGNDGSDNNLEHGSNEDFFMHIPHISMPEGRFNIKTDNDHPGSAPTSTASLRNAFGPGFNLEYNFYKNNAAANSANSTAEYPNELYMPNDYSKNFGNHMEIPPIAPGEHWFQGKLEFMLSQRGKPLLVHDGHTFGIQYVRKDKKYWQCNLSRKFNCKARVTTTDTGEIIVTNNEHCHTEIRQHLRKDYQRNKVMMNSLLNLSNNRLANEENIRRHNSQLDSIRQLQSIVHANLAGLPLGVHDGAGNEQASDLDVSLKRFQNANNINNLVDDNDDDDDTDNNVPLDFGIRSQQPIEKSNMIDLKNNNNSNNCNDISTSNANNTNNDNNGGNGNGNDNFSRVATPDDWKCKTESSN